MARKIKTSYSLAKLQKLSAKQLNRMSEKRLRGILDQMQSVSNQRISRLERSGIKSGAYNRIMATGGKISRKQETRNDVLREVTRAQKFIRSESSTVRGYRRRMKRATQTFNIKFNVNVSVDDFSRMYDIYHKVMELNPAMVRSLGSPKIMEMINEYMDDYPNMEDDEIVEAIYKRLEGEYEESQQSRNSDDDWFFSF